MSTGQQPFELLQRMQQQAAAAGYTLPEMSAPEERWHGLAFGIGNVRLVVDLTVFTDIVECGAITPVPRTRSWVRGITNVRGSLYSIVDLGELLGLSRINTETEGKLLVINDPDLGCALLVNRIYGLRRFDHDNEHREAGVLDGAVQPYVRHAYLQEEELWGVLDMEKLTRSEKFQNVEADH